MRRGVEVFKVGRRCKKSEHVSVSTPTALPTAATIARAISSGLHYCTVGGGPDEPSKPRSYTGSGMLLKNRARYFFSLVCTLDVKLSVWRSLRKIFSVKCLQRCLKSSCNKAEH